jgi:hypothetical protein
MLSVPVRSFVPSLVLVFVGFDLVALAVFLRAPRKHVVRYFRTWDANLKQGVDPVNPLLDAPDHYIKIVPDGRVARVIQVTLDPEKGDRDEKVVEEVPA